MGASTSRAKLYFKASRRGYRSETPPKNRRRRPEAPVAWVKSPVFGGLTADGDPIIGGRRRAPHPNPDDELTCPADPVRRKSRGLPQFTRLLGGGYSFLPGMTAIEYIAAERGETGQNHQPHQHSPARSSARS